jgi:dTDP-4-dehydrorhamnose reductase
MLHLMQKEPLLRIVNDQRGRPTYTLDLAEFLIAALDWSGIYHFANQGETSWHAFATAIFNELKKPIACKTIAPISTREFSAAAKRPLYSVLDTSLAESKVSHNLRPWTEGMKELCAAWNAS